MAERAESEDAPDLNDWEKEFVDGVSERLNKYGSAFRDPSKGPLDEALSQRQTQIVRVLDKKTRPKTKSTLKQRKPMNAGSGFKRKTPERKGRVRDINDDVLEDTEAKPEAPVLRSVKQPVARSPKAPEPTEPSAADEPMKPAERRAGLRVIKGGRSDD